MNNVKLLHIKYYFFQIFNSSVALKNNKKNLAPQEKVEMTPLRSKYFLTVWFVLENPLS